jgi:hypothetical protein
MYSRGERKRERNESALLYCRKILENVSKSKCMGWSRTPNDEIADSVSGSKLVRGRSKGFSHL